jgi:hypothetical protein
MVQQNEVDELRFPRSPGGRTISQIIDFKVRLARLAPDDVPASGNRSVGLPGGGVRNQIGAIGPTRQCG